MDFSIFFFSSYDKEPKNKYDMLFDIVKYADQNGYKAVWTPERHFHEFGGLFPNPAVLSAGISMVSERIKIRSGSIVSPLHNSLRIVEDWSVVDNLSKGRVELSFASGWHANDFVFFPERYDSRSTLMYNQIKEVKDLWTGKSINLINGKNEEVSVKTYPRPYQSNVNVWITSNGSEKTIQSAAQMGANLLTNFIGQDVKSLEKKIKIYRKELKENGYEPKKHKVSVMMHTFIGDNLEHVEKIVKPPFIDYLTSSIGLIKQLYRNYSNYRDIDISDPKILKRLSEVAFSKYWQTSALLGTVETCIPTVEKLKEIGVDEIACLVDFGIEKRTLLEALPFLTRLKNQFN